MRVRVNPDLCDASGKCAKLCPEIFQLDKDGYPNIDNYIRVSQPLERSVRAAEAACPTAAVQVSNP